MIHDRNQGLPIATLFSTSVSISEFRRHGLVVGGVVLSCFVGFSIWSTFLYQKLRFCLTFFSAFFVSPSFLTDPKQKKHTS